MPVGKALDDVLLAYEMNGEPLLPDHGHPLRLAVPHRIGVSSTKWVGRMEVSDQPLFSPWNTQFYRFFGLGYPADGQPFDKQVIKSAFELDFGIAVPAGRTVRVTGRSWSAGAPIRYVNVSTDSGRRWRRARPIAPGGAGQRWELDWRPDAGEHELLARATDVRGHVQPDITRYSFVPVGSTDIVYLQPALAVNDRGQAAVCVFAVAGSQVQVLALTMEAGTPGYRQRLVTGRPFDATRAESSDGEYYLSDHQGLAAAGDAFHAVWNDTRTGHMQLFTATV